MTFFCSLLNTGYVTLEEISQRVWSNNVLNGQRRMPSVVVCLLVQLEVLEKKARQSMLGSVACRMSGLQLY